jgi:hypothetical protein
MSRMATVSLILALLSLILLAIGSLVPQFQLFCLSAVLAFAAVLLGLWSLWSIFRNKGQVTGKSLAFAGIALSVISPPVVYYGVTKAVNVANGMINLELIASAMHGYLDRGENKTFPPAAIYSKKDGKPLLSWRVAILPYLADPQATALYKRFQFDEPWDSATNKPLLAEMPRIYAAPGGSRGSETFYRVFVGPETMFAGSQGKGVRGITDGAADTILVIEAGEAVPWTKPDELQYSPDKPLPKLGGIFGGDFTVVSVGGDTYYYKKGDLDEKTLRAAITPAGGEADFLPAGRWATGEKVPDRRGKRIGDLIFPPRHDGQREKQRSVFDLPP